MGIKERIVVEEGRRMESVDFEGGRGKERGSFLSREIFFSF